MTEAWAPSINGLRLRAVMGHKRWFAPQPFGPDGWQMLEKDRASNGTVVATCAPWAEYEIFHASIAFEHRMPEYADLVQLHDAVWGEGYAYQVFVPTAQHVNIHQYALHLWGRGDGLPMLPEFGMTLPSGQVSI